MCYNSDFRNKKPPVATRISKPELLKGAYPFPYEGQQGGPTAATTAPTDDAIGALLVELRGIREEQKKLHEEMRALKQQNERLETRLSLSSFAKQLEVNNSQLNMTNGRIAASLATLADRLNSNRSRPKIDTSLVHNLASRSMAPPCVSDDNSGHTSHSPIVVFDLTTKPATVMSATDNFCKMMGYAMHEVTGMPWHKFIHPNYIDRTMNIFNQTHLNTTVQFSQVYKTKDGHVFHTLDTHKIFYGTDGKPISDIVSILLQPHQDIPAATSPVTSQVLSITEKENTTFFSNKDGPSIYAVDELSGFPLSQQTHPPQHNGTHIHPITPELPTTVSPPLVYSPPSPSNTLNPESDSTNTPQTTQAELSDLESFISSLPTGDLSSYTNISSQPNATISDAFTLNMATPLPNSTESSIANQPYDDIFEYILSP
jgi:PAS domain S-box-containing protein